MVKYSIKDKHKLSNIEYVSYFLPFEGEQLHLKRITKKGNNKALFMLHGAISNGRIFYSDKGKGIAPYLAEHGFDVFIGELRGRGLSNPKINKQSNYGQTEAINDEIPYFIKVINELTSNAPLYLLAHSWGGVLLSAVLAKFPAIKVEKAVFVGTKRSISVQTYTFRQWLEINFMWNFFGRVLCKLYGFLPAVQLGFGVDNETTKSYNQSRIWVNLKSNFIDPETEFDYSKALKNRSFPDTLFLGGANDPFLGNEIDIKRFMDEINHKNLTFQLLSKENKNLLDYNHKEMLVSKEAEKDVFPIILEWFEKTPKALN